MQFLRAAAFLLAGLSGALPARAGDLTLLMVEQPGCNHCAAWHAEVGPEYPVTAEGRAAPLQRQDLRADLPDGVTLVSPPVFTPTFVLLDDGQEVARLEGYPGEDFFWGLLSGMIRDAGGQIEG